MSQMARIIEQAKAAGIDPAAECTDAGMSVCLTKADNLGLINYKPGMSVDWLDSMQLWCHEHDRKPMSFQEVAAAVLQLSVDSDEAFLRPKQLWTAIAAYRARQLKKAMKGAHAPEIPAEIAGDVARELEYRRAWTAYAAVSGDAVEADRQARAALQLAAVEEPRQVTGIPDSVKEKIKQFGVSVEIKGEEK